MTDSALQAAIQAIAARMKEYEVVSKIERSDADREAELQDYFDQLSGAFGELSDIYLDRIKENKLLPSLDSLLIDPFPLR